VLEGDARTADAALAAEHLDRVVEAGGREVLDRDRPHHELALAGAAEQSQVAQVLGAGEVEVGEVAAVVDDPLRVRVRAADAGPRGVLERRQAIGRATELERGHAGILPCRRMTPTSASPSSAWTVVPQRPVIVSEASIAFTIASSVASIVA